MSWSAICEPTVLISAGIALLIGFSWLRIRRGAVCKKTRVGEPYAGEDPVAREFNPDPYSARLPATTADIGEMTDRLEEEKREINRLLDEARQTASRLEEMLRAFEQTFFAEQSPHGSVSTLFDGLSDSMLGQCRAITERTGQIRRKAQSLQSSAKAHGAPSARP